MKNTFKYLGKEFEPIRNFVGREGSFPVISKRLNRIGIDNYTGRWNWDNFFKAAKKAGVRQVDLYKMNGDKIVCPGQNELFEYIKN